ncbi:MAG: hypothetical protein WAN35_18030 [Terracidiphilus sp.]
MAILAVLLTFGLVGGTWPQVPGDGSKQQEHSQDQQKTADPPKPVVVVDSQHGTNNQDKTPEKSAKYPWGELLAPANIPNWFLVIVGAVTGWFVYKTLRAIKKQADIMETGAKDARESGAEATRIALATAKAAQASADAALKTVQVMIDSERPWVIASMEQSKGSCLLDNGNVRFTWTVKNVGKSPAKLIEAGAMVSLDTMGPPLDKIQYKMEPLDERILVPGDSAPIFVFWSIVENGRTRTRLGKTLEEFNDLAIVYGCIRYRSAIDTSSTYETRFSESSPISNGICDGFEISWPIDPEDIRCT